MPNLSDGNLIINRIKLKATKSEANGEYGAVYNLDQWWGNNELRCVDCRLWKCHFSSLMLNLYILITLIREGHEI